MPVQARTRKQLRQSIGYNLGAIETGTAYDAGSTTTLVSLSLVGGDDNYNGKRITVFDTSNSDSPETRIIKDFEASAYRLTWQEAISFATVASPSPDTYEIWNEPYHPDMIHDFINQAIIDVTGQAYDPIEVPDMSTTASRASHSAIHADGSSMRYDIPSNVSIINRLYYRSSVSFTELHSCNSDFDGASVSNFTSSVDTEDKKKGTGSVKFELNDSAGVAAGAILTSNIASKNISKYDYLECWIKSSISTSSGNLKISLGDTANCVSPLETVDVPSLTEDTWTFVRMKLNNPELNTGIISIGLEQDADIGSNSKYYVWLDDIKVVQNDTAVWEIFPKHLWRIDREARALVLTDSGRLESGYALLKIVGGDKPALLSSDTDTSEIDDSYIIARATALAFSSASGGAGTDPDTLRQQSAFWFGLAEQSKRAFPLLITGRVVE